MNNQISLTNAIPRIARCGLALAGLVQLGVVTSSFATGGEVLPPSSLPYGYSYQEWSAKWWQWSLGQSTNHIELTGGPGICEGPASQVRFLAGVYLPSIGGITVVTNHVIIGDGTPLFFPILANEADNTACPTNNFTTLTADQLAAEVEGDWSAVTETSCTIDGVAVTGLQSPTNTIYNVVSPPFSYTTAEKDSVLAFFGDTCLPGGFTVYPTLADGVYLMLSPLPLGKHTIHLVGVVTVGGSPIIDEDITYDITVSRDCDPFHN